MRELLAEVADFVMMRRCRLALEQRAEARSQSA
jgi:hypothetical protein